MNIFRRLKGNEIKKNLVIIGARGLGREFYNLFLGREDVNIKGFLDDKEDALNNYKGYPPILGSVEAYKVEDGDVFICALGDPYYREKYSNLIKEKGGIFVKYIGKNVVINPTAKIGDSVVIMDNTIISSDVTIGDFVVIHPFSNIGHDVSIGAYCEIEAYAALGGSCKIKKKVTIHPHATILPYVEVGDLATVGAGSVVIRNVKEGVTVFGVPATILKF